MRRIGIVRPTILMVGDIRGPDHYHVGDEAIFRACGEWVKEAVPECQLVAVSRDPQFTSENLSIESISQPNLVEKPPSERALRPCREMFDRDGSTSRRWVTPDREATSLNSWVSRGQQS